MPDSQKKRELVEAEKHPVIEFFEQVINGTDNRCNITRCSEIDVLSDKNYYDCQALYKRLKAFGDKYDGAYFIEQKKLFDRWRNNEGKNRRETMNRFIRIIKKNYGADKVEAVNDIYWKNNKPERLPFLLIKEKIFKG